MIGSNDLNARESEIATPVNRAFARRLIEGVLNDFGPLSTSEIAAKLGLNRDAVKSVIVASRDMNPRAFYIFDWAVLGDQGGNISCFWDVGDKPDAIRPPPKRRRRPVMRPRDGKTTKPALVLDTKTLRALGHAHDPFGRITL